MSHSIQRRIFLSAVTSEFGSYRKLIADDLRGPSLDAADQDRFFGSVGTTLELLDDYIRACDAVVHLVGDGTGTIPKPEEVAALTKRYGDLLARLPGLSAGELSQLSYTQWEAYLASYHDRSLHIYFPNAAAPRDAAFRPSDAEKELQKRHFQRLCDLGRNRREFASQERLSSMVLRDLQHILPLRDSDIVTAPARLRHGAETLIGREKELDALDAAWASESTHVVVIRAWGGVGKTSLAATWMAEMALKGWRGAQRYFDWSFYSQGTRAEGGASADVFIAEALKFFGDPDPQAGSPWDRGARLAGFVRKSKTLLVLDGLEPLQQPPGPEEGKLKDPALQSLLRGLAPQNAGLCVITTREKVTDLESFHGGTVIDYELEQLSEAAGAALLHGLSVQGTEAELRQASREVKGHALTLQLMGRYLSRACGGDVRKRDTFGFIEADAEVQGHHAFKILASYERWLEPPPTLDPPEKKDIGIRGILSRFVNRGDRKEHGSPELAILRMLGLFDRPADPGCLMALRKRPAIPGLTEALPELPEADWNIAVSRLEEIGLVSRVPFSVPVIRGYDQATGRAALARNRRGYAMDLPEAKEFRPRTALLPPGGDSLDAHPLLREYFEQQVREAKPDAWREAHRRLFEHLQARVPYWPEGLEGLQPLFQAVVHGCRAGRLGEAGHVFVDRIQRGTGVEGFYSINKLGAFGADLGALAAFFDSAWDTPSMALAPGDSSWLLNVVAFDLEALGRLAEALQLMRAGLEIEVECMDWKSAAVGAGNLSGLELALGDIAAAISDSAQSIAYAERSGNAFQRMTKRAIHADVLHQAGRQEEALRLFQTAEALQAEWQPEYPRLYSLPGFLYCELLLHAAERTAWQRLLNAFPAFGSWQPDSGGDEIIQRTAETLRWAEDAKLALLDIALHYLSLARAVLYREILAAGLPDEAIGHLNRAVDGLRRAGQLSHLPRGLLAQAWARFLTGDEAGCRADLDEAQVIAERGGMRLHLADVHLHRARLFRDREELDKARELIAQTGYHRRDEELRDAEAAMGL